MTIRWTKIELEQFNRKKGQLPADNTGTKAEGFKKRVITLKVLNNHIGSI